MCGIAGMMTFGGQPPVEERVVTAMRETLSHRGPNGGCTWVDDERRIGLGHRRLSIIDLAVTASQPMANEDGRIQLVFNGEIYNHAELRAELSRSGRHRWATDHSDTETIVHGFEVWGIECVHRLRGMFALAIWDARERALWLVRDRIGIKPLYYRVDGGKIAFASEIKALLELPDTPRRVHEEALFHYLSFLTTPGTQTLFDGIQKLEPGTWLRAGADGSIRVHRYWDVWEAARSLGDVPDEAIAERVLAELRTSVRLRKLSDVPVGVFLSGGLDSSTNAALFSEGEGHPIRTFSIGYDRDYAGYANELHFARAMAERIGAEHHEKRLTRDDVVEFLPRMVHLQDEPIADPVCVPVYYVARLARESGTIVCQLGEGADELFIGYPNWWHALERQQMADLPVPRIVPGAAALALKLGGYDHAWQYEYLRRASRGEPLFWGGAESFAQADKLRLLGDGLRTRLKGLTSWDALAPIHRDYRAKAHEQSALNWMSYVDLRVRLPELLLMRVDKMTMGVGLEARVPFLDHEFVTLAMSVPSARKAPNGRLKHLLKLAVRDLVPVDIIERRKQGFGVPVDDLFAGRLAEVATKELTRFCNETGLIDKRAALDLIRTGQGAKTWYLLNLAMWWRHFIAGEQLTVA